MRVVPLIFFFWLTACSTHRPDLNGPSLGPYNFSYSVESPRKAKVIQVFDNGKDTFFKIYKFNTLAESIRFKVPGEVSELAPVHVQGNLVLIRGLYDEIEVILDGKRSLVRKEFLSDGEGRE